MSQRLPEHIAALILDLAVDREGKLTYFISELPKMLRDRYGLEIPDDLISQASAMLLECGAASRLESPLTGDIYNVTTSNFFDLYEDDLGPTEHSSREYDQKWQDARDKYRIFQTYYFAGDEWVKRVLPALNAALAQGGVFEDVTQSTLVPASDRVVSRTDNLDTIAAIEDGLDELVADLQKNNEVGAALGDDRTLIEEELEDAKRVLKRERFRLSSIIGWLVPVLKFLAKRFAGTSVDEAAKLLINLLEKLT